MSIVVVTGASGFVGTHVCRDLAAHGWAVRALVRRPWVSGDPAVVPIVCDAWNDAAALRSACDGAHAVVHLAGRAHMPSESATDSLDEFRAVNVELTRSLLEAARRAGVKRLLYLSSIGAVCNTSEQIVDDSTPPAPTTMYGRSKLEAERLVLAADGPTMLTMILRPPMIYGPDMKGNPLRLFDLVWRRLPLPVGAIRNRRSMLYVDNLAAAIRTLLAGSVHGRAFVLADDDPRSTPDLVRQIGDALGRPARLLYVPLSLLRSVGYLGDLAGRFARIPFSTADVDRLSSSLELDPSAFSEATGYRPPYTTIAGLRTTAEWYRRHRGEAD